MPHSLHVGDDPASIDKEGPTDFGEADASAPAFKKLSAELVVHSRDLPGEAWQTDAQPFRRTTKDEFLGRRNEQLNVD